jgi:hypothetical protein
MQDLKDRAAEALDSTHHNGERGPKTFMARKRLAEYLDGVRKNCIREDVEHLEKVSKQLA